MLVIGAVWPEPTSSAAGWRLMELMEFFSKSFDIHFCSAAEKTSYSADLSKVAKSVSQVYLNNASFDQFVKGIVPDAVLYDRFMTEEQFGWRVEEQAPHVLKILDMEDFHSLRKARQKAVREHRSFSSEHLFTDQTRREIGAIYRCDFSLVISSYEMKVLKETMKVPDKLLHYYPFVVDEGSISSGEHYEERRDFVAIGNFLHAPNEDAVWQLKNDIWLKIRARIPEAKLHVYGAYSKRKHAQWHDESQGFILKGRADSALETLARYRVLLSPLRFGAGLKGKHLDAMQTSTPCVTTEIGAEGMTHPLLSWPGAICNSSTDFISASVELYNDALLWREKSDLCKLHLERLFSKSEHHSLLEKKLLGAINEPERSQEEDFFASLVKFHSARSNKYFSKWIEEKNKR